MDWLQAFLSLLSEYRYPLLSLVGAGIGSTIGPAVNAYTARESRKVQLAVAELQASSQREVAHLAVERERKTLREKLRLERRLSKIEPILKRANGLPGLFLRFASLAAVRKESRWEVWDQIVQDTPTVDVSHEWVPHEGFRKAADEFTSTLFEVRTGTLEAANTLQGEELVGTIGRLAARLSQSAGRLHEQAEDYLFSD